MLEPGTSAARLLLTGGGTNCQVPGFDPPFSFDAPGWYYSMTSNQLLSLSRDEEGLELVNFYRYGGAVVTDSCVGPPPTEPIGDVNELSEWMETVDYLRVMALGRSVGPNPAWQFDLQALQPPACPSEESFVSLWTIELPGNPWVPWEVIYNSDRLRAYFILVGEKIVVMTVQTPAIEDQNEFEFAAEDIFSSLLFSESP